MMQINRPQQGVRKDVIYESKHKNILGGDSPIMLINELDTNTNNCLTIAKYSNSLATEIKTSENVANLIGQENYSNVFAALCSVINQELRVKGILALLTNKNMEKVNVSTQTNESFTNFVLKTQNNKKNLNRLQKRKLDPYVVLDEDYNCKVKKEDIVTNSINEKLNKFAKTELIPQDCKEIKVENSNVAVNPSDTVFTPLHDQITGPPLTSSLLENKEADFGCNEDSNLSIGNISCGNLTVASNISEILNEMDFYIEQCTNVDEHNRPMIKPEDDLHIATPEILSQVSVTEQQQLIKHQIRMDFLTCLQRDADNCLPIHNAVITNDMHVLWRHCHMLKGRLGHVDVVMDGELTPLHLALQSSNLSAAQLLLRNGADVTRTDASERSALHHAVNKLPNGVLLLTQHCRANARKILSEDEDMWKPELQNKSDAGLALHLGNELGSMYDGQGYTALMTACRAGWSLCVEALLGLAPNTVDLRSKSAGETALYLAVAAACLHADNRGPKASISDEYLGTIKVLISHGADPNIQNQSSASVFNILSDYNYPEITLLVTSAGCFNPHPDVSIISKVQSLANFILVKDKTGQVELEAVSKNQKTKSRTNDNRTKLRFKTKNIRVVKKAPKNNKDKLNKYLTMQENRRLNEGKNGDNINVEDKPTQLKSSYISQVGNVYHGVPDKNLKLRDNCSSFTNNKQSCKVIKKEVLEHCNANDDKKTKLETSIESKNIINKNVQLTETVMKCSCDDPTKKMILERRKKNRNKTDIHLANVTTQTIAKNENKQQTQLKKYIIYNSNKKMTRTSPSIRILSNEAVPVSGKLANVKKLIKSIKNDKANDETQTPPLKKVTVLKSPLKPLKVFKMPTNPPVKNPVSKPFIIVSTPINIKLPSNIKKL